MTKKKRPNYYVHENDPVDPYDNEVIAKRKVSTRVGLRESDGCIHITDYAKHFQFSYHHPCAAISIWYKLGEVLGVSREDARELLEERGK